MTETTTASANMRLFGASFHATPKQTMPYMSHAAREPARRIGTASSTNASPSPRQPNRSRASISTNGASTASTGPSLRLPAPKMPERRSASAGPPRL